MFKVYPQPPFKKYVKTESGEILKTENHSIEPAVFSKYMRPLVRFGWVITFSRRFKDGSGWLTLCEKIIQTADTKAELL